MFAATPLFAQTGAKAEHAVAGEVKKVDEAAKTMVVKTADGAEETVKFTEKTVVKGATATAHATDKGAKDALEGGAVVLYFTGVGVDRTAVGITHLGHKTLKVAKGTVVRADQAGRFVVVKTAEGADETYNLTKDAAVDVGKGVEMAGADTAKALTAGVKVTVHYTEEGTQKVVHLIKSA
jgi:hypothetical protein